MSCYLCFCLICFCNFGMYLLFILWKTVEHNPPLFCLAMSCFFPLTLIMSTLLNFLYFCYLRLESQKVYINSGLTHCIKTFVVAMAIDEMGCVAEAKFFSLHMQEYWVHPDLIKGKVDPNALYNYFLCTLAPFLYTYYPYATFYILSFGDFFSPIFFIVFVIGSPVVNHVDTYGEDKILRK